MLIDVGCCLVLLRLIVYSRFVHLLLLLVVERLFDGCLMSMSTVYISFPFRSVCISIIKDKDKKKVIIKRDKMFSSP